MRHLIAALLLLLPIASAHAKDDVAAIDPTVEVATKTGHGSGVYVGDGLVLTAAHVVDGQQDIEALMVDKFGSDATVVMLDTIDDLALIKLTDPHLLRPVNTVCTEPAPGTPIHTSGFPLGIGRVTVWGRVASEVHADDPWRSAVILDATVERGMSGGPVFDEHNSLVGITVGMALSPPLDFGDSPDHPKATPLTGFQFAVSAPAICRLLALATATS